MQLIKRENKKINTFQNYFSPSAFLVVVFFVLAFFSNLFFSLRINKK